ncbi:MAG: hypothetical protein JKP92_04595 [Alphaproteobacteria bacterium]|jgi:hypothetical protein|nr:hypothetical protein [Alphaproteobacteria bacterium]
MFVGVGTRVSFRTLALIFAITNAGGAGLGAYNTAENLAESDCGRGAPRTCVKQKREDYLRRAYPNIAPAIAVAGEGAGNLWQLGRNVYDNLVNE